MIPISKSADAISRDEAIARLRSELLRLVDEETSICRAAAERGIFCRGFRRFAPGELRARFDWIARRLAHSGDEEIEEIVNRWQLARQEVTQLPLACDVQQREHVGCHGWDDFSREELSRFYLELTGRPLDSE
ncbi:MAG TPA: hypothetical protein VMS56_01705 [Thermoanaerobaculia bacterium]|nr:hypothetical protein [Thermoanaerobaculia bacterium]